MDEEKKIIEESVPTKKFSAVNLVLAVCVSLVIGFLMGGYRFQIEQVASSLLGRQPLNLDILDFSSVQETYEVLKKNYDGKIDKQDLVYGLNRGLVEALGDEHSQYFDPDEAEEFRDGLEGNIGTGIGAELGSENSQLVIVRVLKNNSAEKSGLLAGDIIIKVNDESVAGWAIEKAVSKIRGEAGTTVKIVIERDGKELSFVVTRATISIPSIESKIIDGIGYLQVYRFDSETDNLARLAAKSFIEQGVKGVVVDLRDNGGGFLVAAKDLDSLWLDNKVVAVEKKQNIIIEKIRTDSSRALLGGLPTVILVNRNSASASEIFAGAMQEYNIAKLVGEQTFGKGTVQSMLDLKSGAMAKLTVARWYTARGKNINKKGIKPDVVIEITKDDLKNKQDKQLEKALNLLSQ